MSTVTAWVGARVILWGVVAGATSACLAETLAQTPCLENVEASVTALRGRGVPFEIGLGDTRPLGAGAHWQGIQPAPGAGAEVEALLISRDDLHCEPNTPSPEGARCGGYVLARSVSPNGSRFEIVREVPLAIGDSYDHAGGIQVLDGMLAVGLEQGRSVSRGLVYVTSGDRPVVVAATPVRRGDGSGAVAVSRVLGGALLLAVGGWDSDVIDLYRGPSAPHTEPLTLEPLATVRRETIRGAFETLPYQNLSFLPQCDGALFIVATAHHAVAADERVHLFALDHEALARDDASTGQVPLLQPVAERRVSCLLGEERWCHFQAAAGAHVDDNQRLSVWSVEHRQSETADGEATIRGMRFVATAP